MADRKRQHEEQSSVFDEESKSITDILAKKQMSPEKKNSFTNLSATLEGLYLTSRLLDWAQTRKIARDPARYNEDNSLLGDAPSQSKVDAFMALGGLGHYLLAKNMPEGLRVPLQLLSLADSAKAVNDNKKIGLDINKNALIGGLLLTGLLNMQANKDKEKGLSLGVEVMPNSTAVGPVLHGRF